MIITMQMPECLLLPMLRQKLDDGRLNFEKLEIAKVLNEAITSAR